jgi:hypothetical protein
VVVAAVARLSGVGLETTGVDDTVCCYATKTETWLNGPDGTRWEWYVKHGDADQMMGEVDEAGTTVCCAPEPASVSVGAPATASTGVAAERSRASRPGRRPGGRAATSAST